ncbi:MAG: DUF4278 domain-containing protein [Cyanobacteria bacterium P01_A01_bin.68]
MKLRFLGQAYSASSNSVETVASEHTARFLGRTYTVRRPVRAINSTSDMGKKYRGIAYGA